MKKQDIGIILFSVLLIILLGILLLPKKQTPTKVNIVENASLQEELEEVAEDTIFRGRVSGFGSLEDIDGRKYGTVLITNNLDRRYFSTKETNGYLCDPDCETSNKKEKEWTTHDLVEVTYRVNDGAYIALSIKQIHEDREYLSDRYRLDYRHDGTYLVSNTESFKFTESTLKTRDDHFYVISDISKELSPDEKSLLYSEQIGLANDGSPTWYVLSISDRSVHKVDTSNVQKRYFKFFWKEDNRLVGTGAALGDEPENYLQLISYSKSTPWLIEKASPQMNQQENTPDKQNESPEPPIQEETITIEKIPNLTVDENISFKNDGELIKNKLKILGHEYIYINKTTRSPNDKYIFFYEIHTRPNPAKSYVFSLPDNELHEIEYLYPINTGRDIWTDDSRLSLHAAFNGALAENTPVTSVSAETPWIIELVDQKIIDEYQNKGLTTKDRLVALITAQLAFYSTRNPINDDYVTNFDSLSHQYRVPSFVQMQNNLNDKSTFCIWAETLPGSGEYFIIKPLVIGYALENPALGSCKIREEISYKQMQEITK